MTQLTTHCNTIVVIPHCSILSLLCVIASEDSLIPLRRQSLYSTITNKTCRIFLIWTNAI